VKALGLRARIILLIALALLPAFGLLVWIRIEGRRVQQEEAEERVLARAQLIAESQVSRDEAAQQLLSAITRHESIHTPESPACTAYLRNVMGPELNVYINLGVVDRDGTIVCGTDPILGLGVSDRQYFQDAMETRAFTIGEVLHGRRTGRTLLNYAMPVLDGTRVEGIAIASLNIAWLRESLGRIAGESGSGLALLDRTGAVIVKQPETEWFAERLDRADVEAMADRTVMHVVRPGPDGRERHYAMAWVGGRRDMLAVAGLVEDATVGTAGAGFLTALLILVGGGVLAAGLAFVFAERQIGRPIVQLVQGARRLATGDLTVRTGISSGAAELRELSASFDQMAATLQDRERRARESQRLEAIGQLAGGLAHDFNNMLTVILGFSHALQRTVDDAESRENINEIIGAAERAGNLTTQLLAFARRQVLQPRPMLLNETVAQMGTMLRQVIGEDVTMVTLLGPDAGVVQADPSQMEQILLNLVLNARDAMPRGGTLKIETRHLVVSAGEPAPLVPVGHPALPPGDYVALTVTDTGHGMDAETRARIFEPFFTTKGLRGTGLGLAMAYGITSQSGGYISCESAIGTGTTISLLLPRVQGAAVEGLPAAPRDPAPPPGSETVLVVEDEPSVRVLAERVLRGAGYNVVTADGAAAAMDLIRHGVRPHLVLTDVVMPHMNGVALAESLRLMVPGVQVAYMSGHVEHAVLKASRIAPKAFLRKPFTPDALLRKVRSALDAAVV
jgi:signal transduction histidine kinase/CheY-like chemotaxis protein